MAHNIHFENSSYFLNRCVDEENLSPLKIESAVENKIS
jgi:hypothetical protein